MRTPGGPVTVRRHDDRGDVAVNTAVVVPAVLLVGALLILAGRLVLAAGAVQSAAHEAARAASISRTPATAVEQADVTATTTLANSGLRCATTSVVTDAAALARPVGRPGSVTVTVTCTVPLSDVGLPGLPGSRTMTSTASSVVDAYRERG